MIQRSLEQLSLPSSGVAGRRVARLCQHLDEPAWLLYLAEWSSREAFEAYRLSVPMPGTADQLQRLPACRFYQRLALFERVLTPVSTVHVTTVDGPAATHATRRDLALAYHSSDMRLQRELALLQVHEATDAQPGLLVVSGWESTSPLTGAGQEPEQAMLDRLVANGGTAERFVGRVLAETTGT